MLKTFEQLREIDEIVGRIFGINPELKNTKFGYWFKKFNKKNYQPIIDEINEKVADERLRQALVDEKTNEILYNDATQTNYKFDKAGLQNLIDFNRNILKEYSQKEFEVTPCISDEVPVELLEEEKEILKGLLIPE